MASPLQPPYSFRQTVHAEHSRSMIDLTSSLEFFHSWFDMLTTNEKIYTFNITYCYYRKDAATVGVVTACVTISGVKSCGNTTRFDELPAPAG